MTHHIARVPFSSGTGDLLNIVRLFVLLWLPHQLSTNERKMNVIGNVSRCLSSCETMFLITNDCKNMLELHSASAFASASVLVCLLVSLCLHAECPLRDDVADC